MSDEEATTTIWRDNHSGPRGHQLMTREFAETIPPLYANDGADDPDAVVAKVKLFSPYNGWRWYITEWDAGTGTCFGLVEGFETELGYFELTELSEVTVFGSVPAVERDLYWEADDPRRDQGTVETRGLRQGSEKHQGKGATMPDETGTETTRSDAPSADESLFGDAADGTEAAVADEEDAPQDPQGSDAAEEQAGPPRRPEGRRVPQGRQGHHRRATALVRPAHRVLRRPGPLRADAGGPGGGRTGEGQVGGRTEVSGPRETRSPGQASDPAWAGVGAGRGRRGSGIPAATRDPAAVLRPVADARPQEYGGGHRCRCGGLPRLKACVRCFSI